MSPRIGGGIPSAGREEGMDGGCARRGAGRARRLGAALAAAAVLGTAAWAAAGEEGELAPVEVTATRIGEKVFEQASSVAVVPRDRIELVNPAASGDVLRAVPGLQVQRSGSPGSRESARIRGSLGTHTLVLVDGFPVNSPTGGFFDLGSLGPASFERIEVVRGAMSAFYGSNAIGGVVNFVPRRGEEPGASAGAAGGTHDTFQWNGSAQAGGSRGNLFLGAGGYRSSGFLENDDGTIGNVLGTGTLNAGARHRLHGLVLATDSEKGVPVDSSGPDPDHRFVRRGFLRGVRWESDLARSFTLETSGAVYEEFLEDKDPASPGETVPVEFTIRERKALVRLQGRFSPFPGSTTYAGFEYLEDHGTDRDNFGLDLDRTIYNRSFYLQEELGGGRGAGASLGARVDGNSVAGTEFNPRGAAYVDWDAAGIRFHAAAGRGFRVPTIVEGFDPFVGNPGLVPEVAWSYEAGALHSSRDGGRILSVTWFYQDLEELIQFDGETFRLENVASAFSRGVEAEAAWRVLPWAGVEAGFTWTDSWESGKGRPLLAVPPYRGSAALLLDPAPGWKGRIEVYAEDDQLDVAPDFRVGRRAGYARVDAFAAYRWDLAGTVPREVAVSASVRNLLDREYEERLGIPAPGIHLLLGAQLRL